MNVDFSLKRFNRCNLYDYQPLQWRSTLQNELLAETPNKIDVIYGYTSRGWQFTDINLEKYRKEMNYDIDSYYRDYAYSTMHQGNLGEATEIFLNILEEDDEDVKALNAMGIISYVLDNNADAEAYFTKAIMSHPNNTIAYNNRSQLYEYKEDYDKALADINQVINLDNAQPDNYMKRALLYIKQEKWAQAIEDLSTAIKSTDFKEEPIMYYYRAVCSAQLKKFSDARKDVKIAYNLTDDPDLEEELQDFWRSIN